MAYNATDVVAPVTGRWYVGAQGATLPAVPGGTPGSGVVDLGYVSEDGTTETHSRTTSDIKAHQYSGVVKTVVTESTSEFEVAFLESTDKVLELYFGIAEEDGQFKINPGKLGGFYSFVHFEVEELGDGSSRLIRNYLHTAQVVETEAIEYKAGEPVKYGMKIKAYPDASGATVYKAISAVSAPGA